MLWRPAVGYTVGEDRLIKGFIFMPKTHKLTLVLNQYILTLTEELVLDLGTCLQ